MSEARRGRYSSVTKADSRRFYGGGKSVGQLETIWYEIDARCADGENRCENRSCGRRHRLVVGCREAGGRKKKQVPSTIK
jgi:hypothetical protein